jgi:hypothetical protein
VLGSFVMCYNRFIKSGEKIDKIGEGGGGGRWGEGKLVLRIATQIKKITDEREGDFKNSNYYHFSLYTQKL